MCHPVDGHNFRDKYVTPEFLTCDPLAAVPGDLKEDDEDEEVEARRESCFVYIYQAGFFLNLCNKR